MLLPDQHFPPEQEARFQAQRRAAIAVINGTTFWMVAALILLFTALSASLDLVVHWRARFLADQAWLAAQPLPARQLFGAYRGYLIRRSLPWSLAFGICLFAIGAPLLAASLLALALLTAVFDAILCGYATRLVPWRFPLLLMLHGLIVVSTLQVLPPALPVAVVACAVAAWRRGNQ